MDNEKKKEVVYGAEAAMLTLIAAFESDPDFAHTWHCSIACTAMDAGADHKTANEGASRFMKLAFGVDTSSKA